MTQSEFFEKISAAYNEYEDNKHKIARGPAKMQKEKAKNEIFVIVDNYLGGKA